jgi:hypothetical protein
MKYIHSSETLNIPEGGECHCFPKSLEMQREAPGEIHEQFIFRARALEKEQLLTSLSRIVKVAIKSRLVTVEGPRGTQRMGGIYKRRRF